MNIGLTKIVISFFLAIAIAACGGTGSSGVAGIGGSGYISSGSISGFGSVFVNGVEFETDDSTFDIEGVSGTQSDLAIGMIVRVTGVINSDGVTGVASTISFNDELQGPVSALTAPDVDGVTRSFSVLGVNVIVNSGTTSFYVSNEITASTVFNFSNILDNNNVEVSGFFDTDGSLFATRIELKDVTFVASSIVEIKGFVTNFNAGDNTFMINALHVDASASVLENLPDGIVDGEFVEVKGVLDSGIITATKIEREDDDVEDADEFELEGLVTNYIDDSDFKISGVSVDASNADFQPISLKLENGSRVEVEGIIINGRLIADEVELRGGSAKVRAEVSSVNLDDNSFEVTPVAGQPAITIMVTSTTKLEDDVNEIEQFGIGDIVVSDYVEVHGFDEGEGVIISTEVKVKEAEDVLVQGVIQSGSSELSGIIKIFDVEFIIDYPSETEFESENDSQLTQTEFFNSVTVGKTIVKVEDKDVANGVADEVEID